MSTNMLHTPLFRTSSTRPIRTRLLPRFFGGLTLFAQFALIMLPILVFGVFGIGMYVSEQVEEGIMRSVAGTAALYTKSLFEPHAQELKHARIIPPSQSEQLDVHLARQIGGGSMIGLKVWKGDTVAYSDDKALIGSSFAPSELRDKAMAGFVSVIYYNGGDVLAQSFPSSALWRNAWSEAVAIDPRIVRAGEDDDIKLRFGERPVLEIYVPVRETATDQIIAVVESYQVPVALGELLTASQRWSWIEIGSVVLAIILVPAVIVRRGSRTIDWQSQELQERVVQLTMLLDENRTLHQRANSASQRVTEMNERCLRRLGADLHDGPVQLIGMSLLRLDSLRHVLTRKRRRLPAEAADDIAVIRDALRESLDEIRHVAGGLVPAGIETMSFADVIKLAANKHRQRTDKPVAVRIEPLPHEPSCPIKICVYRLIQEGLNNAFHHAAGIGQGVSARADGTELEVVVSDQGPGFCATDRRDRRAGGQGLTGLRDRVEALSGRFSVESRPGAGTRLVARFHIGGDARP
jgi:signal transduction histidine kinase